MIKSRRGYSYKLLQNLHHLPDNLPEPEDDGACDHLLGLQLPDIELGVTPGTSINLSSLPNNTILFFYPMTGRPGVSLPNGWDEIPGARGCTPQACAFRDHHTELTSLGFHVFGVSTQNSSYQNEVKDRLHLPYEMISDSKLKLKKAMTLPTFAIDNREFYKRFTMVVINSRIYKTFYPVFPPNKHAENILAWLHNEKN